jgi:hypothetical protein
LGLNSKSNELAGSAPPTLPVQPFQHFHFSAVDNHAAAVALYYMHYNFCRVHQTLRVTPAMEAGIADHVWTIGELLQ